VAREALSDYAGPIALLAIQAFRRRGEQEMPSMSESRWKYIRTILLALLLMAACLQAPRQFLFENVLFRSVDTAASQYVEDGLLRAASAFTMARAFNAVVSVFQESRLQLEPGGVGMSLALGEALDPVNDLVERFSWIMLTSLTSLGIQRFLIEITPLVSMQVILPLALGSLLAGIWLPPTYRRAWLRLGWVLLFAAILLRFAVPAMAFLNEQVYATFLQARHDQSVEALGRTVTELETQQLDPPPESEQLDGEKAAPPQETSVWGRTKGLISQTVSQGTKMADIKGRIAAIKDASLDLIDSIIDLIVVFVLNTILLPLLFLWGILRIGRLLLRVLPQP